jgi:ATP/maltotriose-dependent transcriptional regulator MalT
MGFPLNRPSKPCRKNVGMRNSIAVVLGTILYMEGDFQTSARYFRDAIERDKRANGTNAVPIAASRWARMLLIQGKLREAERLCRENEAYIRERGARRFYVAGNLYILWGELLREWNQLEAAEKLIREGLRLHEGWLVPQAMLLGLTSLARLPDRSRQFGCCRRDGQARCAFIQPVPDPSRLHQRV